MDIYRKFTAALESLGVRGGVIVAFSGGADSTCLLSLFLAAASRGSFPYPLAAAHLNHGLRGEEAARDADFCKAFCRAHGIPFFYEAADIAALAKETHRGIEETARSARYAFFDRLLAEHTAYTCVATAHNRNDLCETARGLTGSARSPRGAEASSARCSTSAAPKFSHTLRTPGRPLSPTAPMRLRPTAATASGARCCPR